MTPANLDLRRLDAVKSVALIGHGAIAGEPIKRIAADPTVRMAQVVGRSARETVQARLGARIAAINTIADLCEDVDLVLECAGHGSRGGAKVFQERQCGGDGRGGWTGL